MAGFPSYLRLNDSLFFGIDHILLIHPMDTGLFSLQTGDRSFQFFATTGMGVQILFYSGGFGGNDIVEMLEAEEA